MSFRKSHQAYVPNFFKYLQYWIFSLKPSPFFRRLMPHRDFLICYSWDYFLSKNVYMLGGSNGWNRLKKAPQNGYFAPKSAICALANWHATDVSQSDRTILTSAILIGREEREPKNALFSEIFLVLKSLLSNDKKRSRHAVFCVWKMKFSTFIYFLLREK